MEDDMKLSIRNGWNLALVGLLLSACASDAEPTRVQGQVRSAGGPGGETEVTGHELGAGGELIAIAGASAIVDANGRYQLTIDAEHRGDVVVTASQAGQLIGSVLVEASGGLVTAAAIDVETT